MNVSQNNIQPQIQNQIPIQVPVQNVQPIISNIQPQIQPQIQAPIQQVQPIVQNPQYQNKLLSKISLMVIIILNVSSIVLIQLFTTKSASGLLSQYKTQIDNYKQQSQELIEIYNSNIDKYHLDLEKIDLETFQYLQEFGTYNDKDFFNEVQSLSVPTSTEFVQNNMLMSLQNILIHQMLKIMSKISGQNNIIVIGQIIPVLKSVFDSLYGNDKNIVNLDGATYIRLDGSGSLTNYSINKYWTNYYDIQTVPNFEKRQVVGNDFVTQNNRYKNAFMNDLDLNQNTPLGEKIQASDGNILDNKYIINFDNDMMPKHDHTVYQYDWSGNIYSFKNGGGTSKDYLYRSQDNNNVPVNNIITKYKENSKYRDYGINLNVSDPCIDVYWLLCVECK